MRIKVNGKQYTLRKEAKEFYLEAICFSTICAMLFSVAYLAAFIANAVCPM